MVSSFVMPENAYHVRSTSMPSRSHPTIVCVEERLHNLRGWEASQSSSSSAHSKAEILSRNLAVLGFLYDYVNNLLHWPITKQILVQHRHERWVDEMLDGSLRMLDMCSTVRDVLLQLKEHAQDLQSALRRRRGGEVHFDGLVAAYLSLRKKMKKEMYKSLDAMKRMESNCTVSSLSENDQHLLVVIRTLKEVRLTTTSIFEAFLYFISVSEPTVKTSRWSLISKRFGYGKISCQEKPKISEVERVDASFYALCDKTLYKDVEVMQVQVAEKRLRELNASLQSLDDGLSCMFRNLIQIRVSFLNILNH